MFTLFSWFLLELDTADTVLQVASSGQEETNIEAPIDRYKSMFEDTSTTVRNHETERTVCF